MKAEDYKIGNFVRDKENKATLRIDIIATDRMVELGEADAPFTFSDFKGQYYELDAEPIPLTEEWLLKLGYKFSYERINRKVYEHTDNEKMEVAIYKEPNAQVVVIFQGHEMFDNDYVHELQNLWKALTKTELTLKQ